MGTSKKRPGNAGPFSSSSFAELLSNFGFFIKHVLPNGRVVLLGLHLFRMQTLVLCHCVVVASSRTGDEFDFVTHGSILRRLNALAVGTQVSENFLDTVLVDDAQALVGDAQTDESLLGFDPKPLALQIRQKATTSFIMSVRNIIAGLRPFPRHLAYLGHG